MARRRAGQQATRVPTGGPRGQRGELTRAQNIIPLPDRTETTATPPPTAPDPTTGMQPPDIFGPTDQPGEPITAGAASGPGPTNPEPMLPDDPVTMIRNAYLMYPSAGLARLLEFATGETRQAP